MKIYTKTGDEGETALIGGTRVPKSDLRIETYGTVDELNSYIGLVRDQMVNAGRQHVLVEIQDRLFTMGSSLASDPTKSTRQIPDLLDSDIALLEREMDAMDAELPELRMFVLPGGHSSVSHCHVARCVCRRAERLVIRLGEASYVDSLIVKYLNRLSDYLFVLSRMMAQELEAEQIPWRPRL